MTADYDRWKTTEPDECLCEAHGRPKPCPYCRLDRLMERADLMRDERADREQDEGKRC